MSKFRFRQNVDRDFVINSAAFLNCIFPPDFSLQYSYYKSFYTFKKYTCKAYFNIYYKYIIYVNIF